VAVNIAATMVMRFIIFFVLVYLININYGFIWKPDLQF